MDRAMGENVGDLIGALSRKGIPLPYEVGTFIALDVAKAVLRRPRRVTSGSVHIDKLGRIAVESSRFGDETQLAGDVITLLGQLLVASAPGVPERLLTVVEAEPGGEAFRLQRLHDELEATLVPLNRDAATRALARIVREAFKVSHGRPLDSEEVPETEVDSALDAVLGVDGREAEALRDTSVMAMPSPVPAPRYVMQATVRGMTELDERGRAVSDVDPRSSMRPASHAPAQGTRRGPLARLGLRWLGISLLALSAVLVILRVDAGSALRQLRVAANEPATAVAPRSREVDPERAGEGALSAASEQPPAGVVPLGKLRLSTVPAGAQVLLRVVETGVPLPVQQDVAHEFVAVSPADGKVVRALLPATAAFSKRPDGLPAYELDLRDAVGAGHADGGAELGPSLLRADGLGRFRGAVGVVHIRLEEGSLLYKFLGVTPSALLGPLRLDEDTELLLYRRGYWPKTVRLSQQMWQAAAVKNEAGVPSLHLTLSLEPKAISG